MGITLTILASLLILAGVAVIIKGTITDVRTVRSGGRYGTSEEQEFERPIRWVGAIVLSVAAAILFFNSFTIVGAKNVAVEYAFGKSKATLTSGWNWVAPWSDVESFDASLQPLKLSGGKDDNGDPIVVQMNGRTITAQVEVSLEWQLDDSVDITPLWKDYRTFDKITENVVRRRLSGALNTLFDTYNPLAAIKGEGGVKLSDLEEQARIKVQGVMPKGILIRSLYLPKFIYPDNVQAQLNSYVASVNETEIAKQQEQTALARKRANEALADGGQISQAVLYQNCLDLVERLVKDGKALPAAFSCGAPPATVVPVK